jgi:hypothetical protein
VSLVDDVSRIATTAAAYAAPGEDVGAVLPLELEGGDRLYLCAFTDSSPQQSWLLLDDGGSPLSDRKLVRDAASIAALVEVAEESADVPPPEEPRVASLAYLDSLGTTSRNGDFAAALQGALPVVDELAKDVEGNYKLELKP